MSVQRHIVMSGMYSFLCPDCAKRSSPQMMAHDLMEGYYDKRGGRMTVHDDVLRELSTGPKLYTHIVRKCARANLPDGHVDRVLDAMVRSGEVMVREWVVEKGKFQPVYESRRGRQ